MLRRVLIAGLALAALTGCDNAKGTTTAPAPSAPAPSAPAPSAPAPSVTALTGTQRAYVTAVDTAKGTITFDLVEWFEGAAAAAACKADGVTEDANDWCTGYYFRNKNPQLRTMPVRPGAALRVLGESADLHPADLAKVGAEAGARHNLWKLELAGGEIVKADEVFLP